MAGLTRRGRLFAELTAEVFRTRALMVQGSEAVARSAGLTSARWQVLGVIASGAAPVAHVARLVGLTRQSVQQLADAMEADGLIAYGDNPHHKRARLMRPTARALAALARLRPREIAFANLMGNGHSQAALESALDLLRQTRGTIEAGLRKERR